MKPAFTLLIVVAFLYSEGHAQRRPNILVDASNDGGLWWFPQGPEFLSKKPHQGKKLADYLRRKGADVEELPSTFTGLPETARRARQITLERLITREIVIRALGHASDQEIAAYREYVISGGKLLLLSDYVRPNARDRLAESFGVRLRGIAKGENRIDRFVPHPITRKVKPLSCGGIAPNDPLRGCGSGIVSVTGENVTLLGFLSKRTYLDLDFDRRKDVEEPVGAAVLGVIELGRGVVVLIADGNTLQRVPQPLTENIYNFLLNFTPTIGSSSRAQ